MYLCPLCLPFVFPLAKKIALLLETVIDLYFTKFLMFKLLCLNAKVIDTLFLEVFF